MTIQDLPTGHGPRGGDDRRVVRCARQLGCADHAPVAGRAGEYGERNRQEQRDVDRRPTDRPAGTGLGEHQAPIRRTRRRKREPGRGGGGGSTPLSESASSRPTTRAFASSDEPP